jgi:hypothetical protein
MAGWKQAVSIATEAKTLRQCVEVMVDISLSLQLNRLKRKRSASPKVLSRTDISKDQRKGEGENERVEDTEETETDGVG